MPPDSFQLATVVSAPFEENTYIAHLGGRNDCLVVDPGLEPDEIMTILQQHDLRPAAILITHGHSDHIAGNGYLKERFPECPIVVSHGDAPKLTDPDLNLSSAFGVRLYSPPADTLVREGDVYSAAGFDLEVREIPGHSCGHVVFIWHAGQPKIVFGGDVLFAGSVGRTDFPDGSFEQLASNVWSKLFTLPDDTRVLPGHGPITTVGREKRDNPYVGAPAGFRG
jgi:hydroxyacylglutathione hydrolase